MTSNLPTKIELKRFIKDLETQEKEISKKLEFYRGLLALEDGSEVKPKKRKRAKSEDTLKLEQEITKVFEVNNFKSMKLVTLLEKVSPLYPELDETQLRSKIIHLQRSKFLVPKEGEYGYHQLANIQSTNTPLNNPEN